MLTSHIERGFIGRVARAAATAMLGLALAATMVPADALATTDSRGGVQR